MNELSSALYTRLSTTAALTALLAGSSGTSIFNRQAYEGAAYPYVVFNIQGGGDENLSRNRTENLVVYVRGYSAISAAQAGSIAKQIDTALHMIPLTVSGWTNFWLAREGIMETTGIDPSSRPWFSDGAMYRVRLDD